MVCYTIEIILNMLGDLFNIFSGAVPIIMPLLFSPELEIQDQALFAIGNIISKKAKYIKETKSHFDTFPYFDELYIYTHSK